MTIDEAIEKTTICFSGYIMLSDIKNDIEKMMKYNEAMTMAISALRAQQDVEKNDPMTLDELRDMNRQHVWIKQKDGFITGAVIDIVLDRVIAIWATGRDGIEIEREYGKTWLAYRRPPNENHT